MQFYVMTRTHVRQFTLVCEKEVKTRIAMVKEAFWKHECTMLQTAVSLKWLHRFI